MKRKGYDTCTMNDLYKNMKSMSQNNKDYSEFLGANSVSRLMMYQNAKKICPDTYKEDTPVFILSQLS